MDLPWLIGGGVVCVWVVLRVLGSERDRRVRELRYKLAAQAADTAHLARTPGAGALDRLPVRSKVPR